VECIEILWPDGAREEFRDYPVDKAIELRKGQGQPVTREKQVP
jgi:hypothetical protein